MEFIATVTNTYKIEARDRAEADKKLTARLTGWVDTPGIHFQNEIIVVLEVPDSRTKFDPESFIFDERDTYDNGKPPEVTSMPIICFKCGLAWKEDCSGDPLLPDCQFFGGPELNS